VLFRSSRPWLGVLGLVAAAVAGSALLLRAIDPMSGLLVYLEPLIPYGIVAAVSAVVLLLLARWRWAALLGVALVVVSVGFQVPVMVPDAKPSSATPVVVMTLNLHLGQANPQRVVDLVRTHDVDILAVEELTQAEARALLDDGLGQLLPYVAARSANGAQGSALWSRWRLDPQYVDLPTTFRHVAATVTPPGAQKLIVAAVHPGSPGRPTANDVNRWAIDQRILGTWLDSLPDPVVAAGDFNATLDQAPLRALLSDGYHDAAAQTGAFWRPTWPYDRIGPPLVAIDHVLSRGGPVADRLAVEGVPGTDHGALIVRLQVPTSGS
jgi:endonuclease/exonuclease/phosphatase family metal-dependent hydrolase